MRAANLGLRFALELCLLASVAYWGAGAGDGRLDHVALAIAAPCAVATIWGLLVAPRATVRLPRAFWICAQLLLFGLGSAGLAVSGDPALGIVLFAAAIANLVALLLLGHVNTEPGRRSIES